MQKRILVWHFRQRGEERAVHKRLQVLERMGIAPTYMNIARDYVQLPSPQEMFNDFDALLVLGASELFFDGRRHDEAEERRRAYEIVTAVTPHVHYVLEKELPTFAFCFGHQLFAAVSGVAVKFRAEHGKTGTHPVHLTEAGKSEPLLSGVPDTFSAQYAHKDVVSEVPAGAVLLAEGPRCHTAMLRYGTSVYTSQFHPELDKPLFQELVRKIKHYLDSNAPLLVDDTPHATEILRNFGKLILKV